MSNHSLRYRPGRGIHIVVEQAQPTTERMTVHGTSAHVEADPNGGIVVSKFGWGTVVEGGGGALIWVHFAVPTPMVGKTTWLREIFFWFRADGPSLRHIHVYDGRSRIRHFDIHASGDYANNLVDGRNSFTLSNTVRRAVGLSLGFQMPIFTGGAAQFGGMSSALTLFGAGAAFDMFR